MTLGPSPRKTTHIMENTVPDEIILESYPGPLGKIISSLVHQVTCFTLVLPLKASGRLADAETGREVA